MNAMKKEFEREYKIPDPQTAEEVIGYYARRIAEAVKLPAQFAVLAPKMRDFFEHKAFGCPVDLNDAKIVKAMSTTLAHYVCYFFEREPRPVLVAAIEKRRAGSLWRLPTTPANGEHEFVLLNL